MKQTKIKIKSIFPNLIAVSKLDINKFKGSFKEKNLTFESQINTTVLGKNLFTKDEINYLNIELSKIFSELLNAYNIKTFVFKVTSIWKNFYEKQDYQGTHVHPSHFSFIIYYNVNQSNTIFNHPRKSLLESYSSDTKMFDLDYDPKCKKGDIILFPSYLEHWVRPSSNAETIAGNIVFSDITYKN